MLIPPRDAEDFLRAYKELLQNVTGRKLRDGMLRDFIEARDAFFRSKALRANPPTTDEDLLAALKTAEYGQFVLARHKTRGSELIATESNHVYRVKGIQSALRELMPEWSVLDTSVMHYRGNWIWDGLIRGSDLFIAPDMRKDFLVLLRAKR